MLFWLGMQITDLDLPVPWEAAHLRVPTEPEPWPLDKARRISVNSFGVSGSNAHVILDAYGSPRDRDEDPSTPETADSAVFFTDEPSSRLLVFSASHPRSLERQQEQLKAYLHQHPYELDNLAYTLAFHRGHLPYRNYAIASSQGIFDLGNAAAATATGGSLKTHTPGTRQRRVAFVYTGQGAHWAGMGKSLLMTNDAFRSSICAMDKFLQSLPDPPAWTLEQELLDDDPTSSKVGQRGYSHPCATAVQIALTDVLFSLGIRPDVVTAHSGGEACAAYATGSISAEAAMAVAYFRGLVIKGDNVPQGTMAAVALGPKAVEPFLVPGVVIGCENSQLSSTLSGNPVCIQHCVDQIGRRHPDVKYKFLNLETSFHSRKSNITLRWKHLKALAHVTNYLLHVAWLEPLTGPYREMMRPYLTDTKAPSCPHYSSVTGDKIVSDAFGLEYWINNFLHPVRFNTAVRNLLAAEPNNIFIEIGPHPALKAPITHILRDVPGAACAHLPTLERHEDGNTSLLRLAGSLFALDAPIDIRGIVPKTGRVLLDLPTYPWLHNAVHMYVPRSAARFKQRRFPRHPLLGARVVEGNDIEPAWRNMLDLKEAPWLYDHVVQGAIVFPATAYVAMVGEAVRQVSGGMLLYTVRDVSFTTGLTLSKDRRMELYTRLVPVDEEEDTTDDGPHWYNFRIMSSDGTHWRSHAQGFVRSGGTDADIDPLLLASAKEKTAPGHLPRQIDTVAWYQAATNLGIDWRRAFQGLDDMAAGTIAKEASATVYDYDDDINAAYAVHPVVLDSLLQINLVALTTGLVRNLDTIQLPTGIDRLSVFGTGQALQMDVFGEVTTSPKSDREHASSSTFCQSAMVTTDDDAKPVAVLQGLTFKALPVAAASKKRNADMLLGSHFVLDRDFSMMDSIADVLPPAAVKNGETTAPSLFQQLKRAMYLFGWKYPHAYILEIGDGSLDVTTAALEALRPDARRRFYTSYTYACANRDALEDVTLALSERAGKDRVMAVDVEEISLLGQMDLVVLSVSVRIPFKVSLPIVFKHGLTHIQKQSFLSEDELLQDELESVRALMQPWGRLLIYHDHHEQPLSEQVIQQTSDRLNELGFTMHSHTQEGLVLAHPARLDLDQGMAPKTVSLVTANNSLGTTVASQLRDMFSQHNVPVVVDVVDQLPQGGENQSLVISLLDLDTPTFHNLDAQSFRPFIDTLCSLGGQQQQQQLIWVTPSATMECKDPRPAMAHGILRTARMENGLDVTIVETDQETALTPELLATALYRICDGLSTRPAGGSLDPDHDHVLTKGAISVPRMRWFGLHEEEAVSLAPSSSTTSSSSDIMFRNDATYLLVGGMGGIGRTLARWMVENGARSFIFFSRSADSPDNAPFVREIASYHPDCLVQALSGNVASLADVQRAINAVPNERPLAGIMQLSLVLSDNSLRAMTFDEWNTVIQPRVQGTWNLHEATTSPPTPLDFLVVFGSGGGITGYFGQSNYSAANTYLDAFVEYRHHLHLPASLIDVGVVGDVGYLAGRQHQEQQQQRKAFASGGYLFLTEQDVLDAAAVAVRHARDRGPLHAFCLGAVPAIPLQDPANRINWKRDVRFALAHHDYFQHLATSSSSSGGAAAADRLAYLATGAAPTADDDNSLQALAALAADSSTHERLRDADTVATLAKALCEALAAICMRPVDSFSMHTSLPAIGLDSIVAIELVDWIHQQFPGLKTTSIEITQCSSMMHLVGNMIEQMIVNSGCS